MGEGIITARYASLQWWRDFSDRRLGEKFIAWHGYDKVKSKY